MFCQGADWKGDGQWYYGDTLMSKNLYGDKDLDGGYGEQLTSMNVRYLETNAIHLCINVKGSDSRSHHVWKAPKVLNQLHII